MRADRDRLADVLEAIERIERHTSTGREAFDTDELVQVWVVRHLQIIGEAVGHLSEDVRARYPDVPWRSIIGMRHVLTSPETSSTARWPPGTEVRSAC